MGKELSIIVPVHNTEIPLLRRCFDSVNLICAVNFECLIIDDGSCEEVACFCQEYSSKHTRFLYHRKVNGGVSSARNLGLDMATGEYICFVDSDDEIEPTALYLHKELMKEYDLIFTDLQEIGTRRSVRWEAFSNEGIITCEMAVERLCACDNINGPVCKLIKSCFLRENQLFFDENMIQGEDICFFLKILRHNPKMLYIPNVSYYYYRSYQHSNTRFVKQPRQCLEDLMNVYNETIKTIEKAELQNENLLINNRNKWFIRCLFSRALDSVQLENLPEIQKELQYMLLRHKCSANVQWSRIEKIKIEMLQNRNWWPIKILERVRFVVLWAKGLS